VRVRSVGSRSDGHRARVPLRLVSLISAARSRSEGPEKKVSLQPAVLLKSPCSFEVSTRSPPRSSKIITDRSFSFLLTPELSRFRFSSPFLEFLQASPCVYPLIRFRPSVFAQNPLEPPVFLQIGPWILFQEQFSRLSSVLGVLYVHAIVVTRRIVLGQFCVLFYCIGVLFSYNLLLFVHVCICGLCLMIVSRRGAFGRVPGAAIFRAVRAAAGKV
jgi:hypothetical protein